MYSFWILLDCLSFVLLTPVGGQIQVIGSHQPIIAAPGDDVLLPCLLEPKSDVYALSVEWSNLDYKPRSQSPPGLAYLRQNGHEVQDKMIPSCIGRTMLFTDGLKEGNVSLLIKNVTVTDEGHYRCFIPNLSSVIRHVDLHLVVVDPNGVKTTTRKTQQQTRDTTKEPEVKGYRHHWIPAIVFGIFLILVFSIGAAKCVCTSIKGQNDLDQPSQSDSSSGIVV